MSELCLPIRPLQSVKHKCEVYKRLLLVSWSITILMFNDMDCIKVTNKRQTIILT